MNNTRKHVNSPRKSDEELLQVQLRVLREGYLYPERRMEVVDIHIERGQRRVPVYAERVLGLREPVSERGTVYGRDQGPLHAAVRPHRNVHLGGHTTDYGKVGIDVGLDGRVPEIDLRKVPIVLLRQIERELVVNGQVVVA